MKAMAKCIECGLPEGNYTLPDKQGKLWTMGMMEIIPNDRFFDHFTDEVYDKCDWKEVALNKRHGALYCSYCENTLYADEIRTELIIAKRTLHEQRTGQLQMFPELGVEL